MKLVTTALFSIPAGTLTNQSRRLPRCHCCEFVLSGALYVGLYHVLGVPYSALLSVILCLDKPSLVHCAMVFLVIMVQIVHGQIITEFDNSFQHLGFWPYNES